MSTKHFIITRFNLSQRWDRDHAGKEVLDDRWLAKRFQLFEDYCFPSVKNQTNKNFEWWVFFDTSTNAIYKDKIASLCKELSNFKPQFKDSYQDFDDTLAEDLYNEIKDREIEYIITTRLDNDDAIANEAVDILQQQSPDEKCILEMPIGYNLKLGSVNKLRKMYYPLNPFISLKEKVEVGVPPETVYAFQHGEWSHLPSVAVSHKPLWVQIIHGGNVSNLEKGKEIVTFGALKGFSFKKPAFSTSHNLKLLRKQFKNAIKRVIGKK